LYYVIRIVQMDSLPIPISELEPRKFLMPSLLKSHGFHSNRNTLCSIQILINRSDSTLKEQLSHRGLTTAVMELSTLLVARSPMPITELAFMQALILQARMLKRSLVSGNTSADQPLELTPETHYGLADSF
jgi:hypothetical protein